MYSDLYSFPTRRSSDLDSRSSRIGSSLTLAGKQICAIKVAVSIPAEVGCPSYAGCIENLLQVVWILMCAFSGIENRSEEHTSELQSRGHLVCRLLLEKK